MLNLIITTLLFSHLIIQQSSAAEDLVSSFTYKTLIKIIQSKGVYTMEDMIDRLPDAVKPEYVPANDSRSTPKVVSDQEPRPVFNTDRSKLMFAFVGDPEKEAGKILKVIYFDEKRNKPKWRFSKVDFSGPNPVIYADPPECKGCHRGRPIWDTYPFWPGVYGSMHTPAGSFLEEEEERYKKFLSTKENHPRYSRLVHKDFQSFEEVSLAINAGISKYSVMSLLHRLKGNPRFAHRVESLLIGLSEASVKTEDFIETLPLSERIYAQRRIEKLTHLIAKQILNYIHKKVERENMNRKEPIQFEDIDFAESVNSRRMAVLQYVFEQVGEPDAFDQITPTLERNSFAESDGIYGVVEQFRLQMAALHQNGFFKIKKDCKGLLKMHTIENELVLD